MEPITLIALSSIISEVIKKSLGEASQKLSKTTIEAAINLNQKITEKFSNDEISAEALAEVENSESEDLRKNSLEKVTEHLEEEISKDPKFAEDIQVYAQDLLTHLKNENSQFAQEILDRFKQIIKQSNDDVRQDIKSLKKEINDINVNIAEGDYVGACHLCTKQAK